MFKIRETKYVKYCKILSNKKVDFLGGGGGFVCVASYFCVWFIFNMAQWWKIAQYLNFDVI